MSLRPAAFPPALLTEGTRSSSPTLNELERFSSLRDSCGCPLTTQYSIKLFQVAQTARESRRQRVQRVSKGRYQVNDLAGRRRRCRCLGSHSESVLSCRSALKQSVRAVSRSETTSSTGETECILKRRSLDMFAMTFQQRFRALSESPEELHKAAPALGVQKLTARGRGQRSAPH